MIEPRLGGEEDHTTAASSIRIVSTVVEAMPIQTPTVSGHRQICGAARPRCHGPASAWNDMSDIVNSGATDNVLIRGSWCSMDKRNLRQVMSAGWCSSKPARNSARRLMVGSMYTISLAYAVDALRESSQARGAEGATSSQESLRPSTARRGNSGEQRRMTLTEGVAALLSMRRRNSQVQRTEQGATIAATFGNQREFDAEQFTLQVIWDVQAKARTAFGTYG